MKSLDEESEKDKLSSQRLLYFSALVKDKDIVGQTSIRLSGEVFERAASVETNDRNKRWKFKHEERRRFVEIGHVFLFNSVKATGTSSYDAVNRWSIGRLSQIIGCFSADIIKPRRARGYDISYKTYILYELIALGYELNEKIFKHVAEE